MFGHFTTKNHGTDLTVNPNILYNLNVGKNEIEVHGLKLQDSAHLIVLDKVSTTTFEKAPTDIITIPEGGGGMTWKDNKVYYESAKGEKEYPLTERIKSVLDFGGILHMKSGAKYVVQDRIIIGLGIHGDIVKPYQNIPKRQIENKFGKASRIEVDYEQTDGELWNCNYYYESREMVVSFFDPDKKINYINIGLFPSRIKNNLF